MRNRARRALRSALVSSAIQTTRRSPSGLDAPVRHVEGTIQHVDPVGRELPVLIDGVAMNFYVPLHCTISVDDERVRMRLLQPRHHARLSFSVEHGVTTALEISVRSSDSTNEQ